MTGYLPARDDYAPALIAAIGMADEPEPGLLRIIDEFMHGVHITRLQPDGSGKADGETNKIMLGPSLGAPIVLAPASDSLALAITEGVEDALSTHEATGLGVWAAGSASRLPALADAVPSYVEAVTIVADADPDGQRHASELARRLRARGGIEVRLITPSARAAA